jgi:cyclic beta-1,2-glucan synthetase
VLAWWISLPVERAAPASCEDRRSLFLHKLARRTWASSRPRGRRGQLAPARQHAGASEPGGRAPHLADQHRHVAAGQPDGLGLRLHYRTGQVLQRSDATLRTMARMERHRGHFYNWYDTQTLAPLHPMYVSAVDSGNLAGHLLTLAPGLERLADSPSSAADAGRHRHHAARGRGTRRRRAEPAVANAIEAMHALLAARTRQKRAPARPGRMPGKACPPAPTRMVALP